MINQSRLRRLRASFGLCGIVVVLVATNPAVRVQAMDATDCRDGSAYLSAAKSDFATVETSVARDPARASGPMGSAEHAYDMANRYWGSCFVHDESFLNEELYFQESYLRLFFEPSPDRVLADAQRMAFVRSALKTEGDDLRFPERWSSIERYNLSVQSAARLVRKVQSDNDARAAAEAKIQAEAKKHT